MAKSSKKTTVKIENVVAVRKQELAAVSVGVNPLVDRANKLQVTSGKDETVAYELSNNVKRLIKQADERRKLITSPLEAAKKETIRLFKDIVAPLIEAKDTIEQKILAYREVEDEKQRLADEERELELQRLEDERLAAEEKARRLKTPKAKAKAVALADAISEQMDMIEDCVEPVADVGISSVVKRWSSHVTDESKVPRKYMMVDTSAIRQAVSAGIREIPGVSIYQVSSVRGR